MTKLIIRKATIDDTPSIVKVSLSAATREESQGFSAPEWTTFSSPEELRKTWAEESKLKDGMQVIVAEKNGNLIGFIVFRLEKEYGYIDNIDLNKEDQRKGIGRALVTHVENVALANGRSLMKTDTTENAKGIPWKSYGFWIKMGYRDTGERLPTKWGFKTIPFVKNLMKTSAHARYPSQNQPVQQQALPQPNHKSTPCTVKQKPGQTPLNSHHASIVQHSYNKHPEHRAI